MIWEQGGRTMVSVIVTADDCFGEDYIIDNQPVGAVAKTHKIVRRPQGSGFQSSHVCVLLLILRHTFNIDDIDVKGDLWL